jgi:hypothetical protein
MPVNIHLSKISTASAIGSSTERTAELVGLGGIEPPTSPLSGVRSSHLSYRPSGRTGGAGRVRTGDLLNANQALSQLSYSPSPRSRPVGCRNPESSPGPFEKTSPPCGETRNAAPTESLPRGGLEWNGCLRPSLPVHPRKLSGNSTHALS